MTTASLLPLGLTLLQAAPGSPAAPATPAGGANYILWGIVLMGVAGILFFLEIFVPSGGLIGFVAASALIGGIVLLFLENTIAGLIGAIVSLAAVPFFFAMAVRVFPNTPIARWLFLRNPTDAPDAAATPDPTAAPLVGKTGKALTELRPVGVCLIDGQRLDCLAEGGVIAAGTAVRVTAADGLQVKVRAEE